MTGTTVVTREPEWDEESRSWALALTLREDSECRRCGGDLNETLDYEFKWEPQPPAVCLRCLGLNQSEKAHAEHTERAGMIHKVVKVPRPQIKPKKAG